MSEVSAFGVVHKAIRVVDPFPKMTKWGTDAFKHGVTAGEHQLHGGAHKRADLKPLSRKKMTLASAEKDLYRLGGYS